MKRLAIIGGGFMGGALAEGLIGSGWSQEELIVAESRDERRRALEARLGLETTGDSAAAARSANSVLFAVKPQDFRTALSQVAPAFSSRKLAISIAAGVRIATLEGTLGDCPVIRAMPNTPAAIGLGVTALAKGRFATDTHLVTALNILGSVGKTVVVEESQMDTVTAVSGTGPAYVFLLAEALIEAAMQEGLTREQAFALTYQTFTGASRLLTHDPADPAELRARVTSPNGTTHAAVTHLQSQGWKQTFIHAVHAARVRSEELGK
ncbi:MAG: pyrroline-5-carboxylate reductase [Candidatus Krumholzibacteriia bacterium]